MAKPRIPISCYRLQFNTQFTFREAQSILGYLERLPGAVKEFIGKDGTPEMRCI